MASSYDLTIGGTYPSNIGLNIEKVSNGFIVNYGGSKFVYTDFKSLSKALQGIFK